MHGDDNLNNKYRTVLGGRSCTQRRFSYVLTYLLFYLLIIISILSFFRFLFSSSQQLCHTCHVARPHRSKHCRITRKCVLLFDHFCPFVDNTVGLNNYKYFYMFLVSMSLAILMFAITLIMYTSRYKIEHGGAGAWSSTYPWLVLGLGIEICFIFFPVAGLFLYHTQLSFVMNLSTNEHMNVRRYKYLYPVIGGRRQFKNPWNKGYVGNFMDRMNPSSQCYEIHADFESLIIGNAPMPASTSCCSHGKCESNNV